MLPRLQTNAAEKLDEDTLILSAHNVEAPYINSMSSK